MIQLHRIEYSVSAIPSGDKKRHRGKSYMSTTSQEKIEKCLNCPLPDCVDGDFSKCEARIARYKRNKNHYRG